MSMVGVDLGELIYAARKAAIDAVTAVQTSDVSAATTFAENILHADSMAIGETVVAYIQANAHATGTDTGTYGGSDHNLNIV